MYKKILIISDNLSLCKRFNTLLSDRRKSSVQWTFGVSPFSEADTFREAMNADVQVFDLRDEATIQKILKEFELVFSIHCKQIFPPALVKSLKCINVHPGYNPVNRGWYPQVFAIINDLPVGATIHEIDEQLDHGPIIDRAFVEKTAWDDSESLYNKITGKEIELLDKNLDQILAGTYKTIKPEEAGNLFLKSDFNALRKIDPDEKMSFREFVNKLRALTHGSFKNAYFIDPATGKKIFVSINLKCEDE